MTGYTKLSSTLVTSTVWRESAQTRVVWITMLALANQHGEVEASLPGLADAARVTIAECEEALRVFLSPDKYSRTTEFEGRRIEAIDGGWVLLNHKKYRHLYSDADRREHTKARVKRWRDARRNAECNAVTQDVTPCNASNGKQKQKQKQKQEKTKDIPTDGGSSGHDTWLTPAMQAWEAVFGPKSFPFGQAAKHLRPLLDSGLTAQEVAKRLGGYLGATEARFASLARFAATHGAFAEDAPKPKTALDLEMEAIAAEAGDASRYVA